MMFVDMVMNLLGRQFCSFVPLVINIFGLFLSHRIFWLLLLLLVLLVAADHGGRGYSVLMPGATIPGQLDLHVVIFGRQRLRMNPFSVQRLSFVQDVLEIIVFLLMLLVIMVPVMMW